MDRAAAVLQGDSGVGQAERPPELDSSGPLDGTVPSRKDCDDVGAEIVHLREFRLAFEQHSGEFASHVSEPDEDDPQAQPGPSIPQGAPFSAASSRRVSSTRPSASER